MKKLRLASLALTVVLLMVPAIGHARLEVLTTTQDLASIAEDIGKNNVLVIPLLQPGDDPHGGTSAISVPLEHVDLLIAAGLELESRWLPKLLRSKAGRRLQEPEAYLDASDGCVILEAPVGAGDQSLGGDHPFGNPHYWLAPENGRIIAKKITARFSELDPVHGVEYQENLRQFETTLTEKETLWQAIAAPLTATAMLATHNSWANFAQAFQLNIVGTIESVPGSPPTAERITQMIQFIRDQKVTLVLVELSNPSPMPAAIADATGAKAVKLATSVGDAPEIKTYFDLLDYDLEKLKEAVAS